MPAITSTSSITITRARRERIREALYSDRGRPGNESASDQEWLQYQMATALIDGNALVAAANLLRSMGATQVFVFGSATKGEWGPDSDVDMAVFGLPSRIYFAAISKVSDLLGRPVDLVDLDDSTPLVRHLLASGELVRVA